MLNPSIWFMNILSMAILYQVIIGYITKYEILKIIQILKWTITVTLLVCVLQNFNLGQFFELIWRDSNVENFSIIFNNPVVGFIGQPTHLAGFLAMCAPLFLYKSKRIDLLCLVLMLVILSFLTGSTRNNIAISGIVVFLFSTFFYIFKTNKKLLFPFSMILLLFIICFYFIADPSTITTLFNDQGRYSVWGYYLSKIQESSWIGHSLGDIYYTFQNSPFPRAMHIHNEFIQITYELGIIGLLGFLFIIDHLMRVKDTPEIILFKSIIVGFLTSCLFTYPIHLWLPASYAVFFYSSIYALENERVCNESINQRRNIG